MRDSSLAINQASIPILAEYRILQGEYLDVLDMSLVKAYQKEISTIELAISQIKDDEEQVEYLSTLETKLSDLKEALANDQEAQILIKTKQDIEGIILMGLVLNIPVMKKFLGKILIGDISKIEFSDNDDYIKFASEVLVNFFTLMQRNKKK